MKLIVNMNDQRGRKLYFPHNETAKKIITLFKTTRGPRQAFKKNELDILQEVGFEIVIREPRLVYE